MRHASDLLLCAVNSRHDRSSELLQHFREMDFLRRSFPRRSLVLGVLLNTSIGIKGANSAIALLQDLSTLLQKGLDGVDEFLLVKFFLGLVLGTLDCLCAC